jgi:predicted dehydrogenase
MCEAARTFGVTLKVGANLRYFPNVQKAKELLDSKIIGDLTFLRGWVGNAGPGIEWFYDPQMSGGGTLIDNGPHILDLARWFLGEITECKGYVGSIITVSVEDIAMATFKTEGGKLAYVQSSWIDWASYMYMEIYGKEGFIRIDQRLPSCCTSLGEKDKMLKKFDYSDLKPQSYTLELADYIDAIRNGRQPQPSGYDGMRILQMIHAVYESSRLGTAVNL